MLVIILAITTILCCCSGQDKIIKKPLRFTNFPLANKLYRAANPGNKNYVTSPIIIQFALAMLYMATNPNSPTAGQIFEHGFHLGSIDKFGGYVKSLTKSLTDDLPIVKVKPDDDGETVLRARLFMAINKRFNVKPNYINTVKKLFTNKTSAVIVGDFQKDGQKFVDTINSDVLKFTNNMIKNFLPAGFLNADTLLSLIGAIYFKAAWYENNLFGPTLFPKTFFLEGGEMKKLKMFQGIVKAPYMESPEFQLIKIPLNGDNERTFGMYILLPKVKDGKSFLSPLQTFVKNQQLNEILNSKDLPFKNVQVTIPEIEFEYEDDLVDDLKSLGIENIFRNGDFSGLTNENRGLFVKEFKQKVAIVVDGNRVEAAAGVHASMQDRGLSGLNPNATFDANHPFLFDITVQRRQNNYLYEHVLFSGQFTGK